MPGGGGEKTEKATPKKKQDERKKGNIFVSKDVTVVLSLLVSFYIMSLFVTPLSQRIKLNFMQQMDRAQYLVHLQTGDVMKMYTDACILIATTILPAMLLIGIVAVLAVGVQSRFLFSYEQIKFKLERINPIKGFQRLISLRSLVELVKSLLKISVLLWLLYTFIRDDISRMPTMFDWEIYQGMHYTGERLLSIVRAVAIAFGGIAALDYLYQWWEYERNLKMTKQEIKEEYKQMEGDPQVKSVRRQKQQEFAQRRMMQQVKDADVIVRNPTHYAVALRYNIDRDDAPMVLAKGADLIAQKIVQEGEKYSIVTVENKPLARGLYETAEINELIPPEFFQPVAELLAWLYSTREKDSFIQ